MTHMHPPSVFPFFLITTLLISHHLKCEARATMNATTPLYDNGETLVSSKSIFELGFFSPQGNNQSSRYVGVWYYKLIPTTIVWVANRDNPLSDSCGSFGIAEDGSLKVWCDSKEIVTFTAATLNPTLQLLDSGNLILVEGKSVTPLWQSFSNPTDTFLPGMELNGDVKLSSWKSTTDPATGDYTFRKDHEVYVIQKRSVVHWRSGEPGSFQTSDGLPVLINQLLSNSSQDDNQSLEDNKERRHISYNNIAKAPSFNNNSRLVMAYSGEIQYYILSEDKRWYLVWLEPTNDCSVYNACGKFGVCELKKEPMCSCPDGFKPISLEDWSDGHYSEGCDRVSTICSRNCSFLKILVMKVGGQATPFDQAETEKACKEECLNNCNCEAYLYRDVNGSDRGRSGKSAPKCWIWTAELENLQQDNVDGRYNLSLRVNTGLRLVNPDTEVPKSKSRKRYAIVVIAAIVVGVILVCWSSYILYKRRRMARQSENQGITGGTAMLFSNQSDRQANDMMHENDKRIDVPFYSLDVVLSATNFFSYANKLGQGGFGPVYKGKFPGGCEIAVKRLSSSSVQGIEEFLNEVILIAKLQHRNLVRLLGYCIKANEKILLYEYMPNRSLDAFIFDQHNCLLLDWKKRFDIILGIARGLLYLHQDSRLRIIHRDLKTSNILLDEDMNPKISDFGLARIVEGKGTEASTNKVVGTYGYMSPEYALDGKFSIKSDVFSFGVVVLEIISGKKNIGFYNSHEVLNLLGYAWRLWSENKAHDLIDPTLLESCDKPQAMKCINIGLLCVQEDPYERPSMSTVVIMLGSESAETLPVPTQPAFVVRRRVSSTSSSSVTKPDMISVNEMTFSMAQGR